MHEYNILHTVFYIAHDLNFEHIYDDVNNTKKEELCIFERQREVCFQLNMNIIKICYLYNESYIHICFH